MSLTVLIAPLVLAVPATLAGDASAARAAAADLVLEGIAAAAETSAAARRMGLLERAAEEAASSLGPARAAEVLRAQVTAARWRALRDEQAAARWLEQALRTTADDLDFTPVREAEMPAGFPDPTPVLEIELKQYPAYRMARAESHGLGGGFWTLFRHIESHQIAMTAPVEMTYAGAEAPREQRMAFLYGSRDLGETGTDGEVVVLDVEPAWVVSLGCRGRMTRSRVAEARTELERWIAANAAWEVAGPLRSMGYNSPMVPAARSAFEVQLPVRRVDARDAARPQHEPAPGVSMGD